MFSVYNFSVINHLITFMTPDQGYIIISSLEDTSERQTTERYQDYKVCSDFITFSYLFPIFPIIISFKNVQK